MFDLFLIIILHAPHSFKTSSNRSAMPSIRQRVKRIEWGVLYNRFFLDSRDHEEFLNCQEKKDAMGILHQSPIIYIIPPIPMDLVSV